MHNIFMYLTEYIVYKLELRVSIHVLIYMAACCVFTIPRPLALAARGQHYGQILNLSPDGRL